MSDWRAILADVDAAGTWEHASREQLIIVVEGMEVEIERLRAERDEPNL